MEKQRDFERLGTVSLTFKEGVEIEAVHRALDELIRGLAPGSCAACGFLGLDVVIRAGDPEYFEKLAPVRGVGEVLDVSVMPRQMGF